MKPILLANLLAAFLLGSTAALADSGHGGDHGGNGHGGYNGGGHGGYNGGGHGGYNGHGHGGYNGWYGHGGYNYGHGGHYYYPARAYNAGYYYPYYYGYSHHNNNNSNNAAAYALGGLVVGSIITNAYLQNRVAQPVYVEQTYQTPTRVVVPQGRRLLKDLSGNCYERTTDNAGNELRTELPPAECNW